MMIFSVNMIYVIVAIILVSLTIGLAAGYVVYSR